MYKKSLLVVTAQYCILIFLINNPRLVGAETLKLSKGTGYESIQITEYQKLHLTSNCFKNKVPKCTAFEATKEITPLKKSKVPLLAHPASAYCRGKIGMPRVLIGTDNKQYDYCLFQDGTMIDSWDLYYKHYPKKVAN